MDHADRPPFPLPAGGMVHQKPVSVQRKAGMLMKQPAEAAVNRQTFSQRMRSYRRRPGALILHLITLLAAVATAAALLFLIGYILVMGIPNLTPELFRAALYLGQRLLYARHSQYHHHGPALPAHCRAAGHLRGHLPGGIRQPGQQAGGRGADDGGNPLGHSLHRLRPVRHAVFRNGAATGAIPCWPAP